MSTNKHEISSGHPKTTEALKSRCSFRNGLSSETSSGQSLPAEPAPFWMGDWRLAIAEERVAMAEERLARAQERWKKAVATFLPDSQ